MNEPNDPKGEAKSPFSAALNKTKAVGESICEHQPAEHDCHLKAGHSAPLRRARYFALLYGRNTGDIADADICNHATDTQTL